MVMGLSEVGFVVCVFGRDPRYRLCSGLAGVGQEFGKERKMGATVNVSASSLYHGPND